MPRSDWITVVVAGALAAALWLIAIELGYNQAYPRSSGCRAPDIEQQIEAIGQSPTPESIRAYQDAYRNECRAEQDLIAQQSMARWAFWLLIVTSIGVGLLVATFWETRRAAIAAMSVVGQAERQAKAAEDSLADQKLNTEFGARQSALAINEARRQADLAEQSYRRLERPYLFIEFTTTGGLRRPGPGTIPFLKYKFANYGKTPAILRGISVGLIKNPPFPMKTTYATIDEAYDIVPPGGTTAKERLVEVIDAKAGESFDSANATLLYLRGIIEYEDPTGALHEDSFMMRGQAGAEAFKIHGGAYYNWRRTTYPDDKAPEPER